MPSFFQVCWLLRLSDTELWNGERQILGLIEYICFYTVKCFFFFLLSVRKNHFQVSRFSEVLYPAILCTCAGLSVLVLQEHGQEFGTVRGQPVP